VKSAETCSCSLCNKFYTYLYHHIAVLDSIYTAIWFIVNTAGMANRMIMVHSLPEMSILNMTLDLVTGVSLID